MKSAFAERLQKNCRQANARAVSMPPGDRAAGWHIVCGPTGGCWYAKHFARQKIGMEGSNSGAKQKKPVTQYNSVPAIPEKRRIMVLYGDVPLIRTEPAGPPGISMTAGGVGRGTGNPPVKDRGWMPSACRRDW